MKKGILGMLFIMFLLTIITTVYASYVGPPFDFMVGMTGQQIYDKLGEPSATQGNVWGYHSVGHATGMVGETFLGGKNLRIKFYNSKTVTSVNYQIYEYSQRLPIKEFFSKNILANGYYKYDMCGPPDENGVNIYFWIKNPSGNSSIKIHAYCPGSYVQKKFDPSNPSKGYTYTVDGNKWKEFLVNSYEE